MQVFFVNGNPRAGKDTFVDMVRDVLRPWAAATSFIDPVKDILDAKGIDYSAKTEADRLLLAEFGDSLERHSSYLSRRCARFVQSHNGPGKVAFIYARQSGPMRTMEAMIQEIDPSIVVRRLLVVRPGAGLLSSNKADAGVNLLGYDVEVHNDRDLDELEELAEHFADLVRKGLLQKPVTSGTPRLHSMKLYASAVGSSDLELQDAA